MSDLPTYNVSLSKTAGSSVVEIRGELDVAGRADLHSTLFDAVERQGDGNLLIDMAGVVFLDSTAISALLSAYRYADEHSIQLSIIRPSPQVTRILQLTGLLDLLTAQPPPADRHD